METRRETKFRSKAMLLGFLGIKALLRIHKQMPNLIDSSVRNSSSQP